MLFLCFLLACQLVWECCSPVLSSKYQSYCLTALVSRMGQTCINFVSLLFCIFPIYSRLCYYCCYYYCYYIIAMDSSFFWFQRFSESTFFFFFPFCWLYTRMIILLMVDVAVILAFFKKEKKKSCLACLLKWHCCIWVLQKHLVLEGDTQQLQRGRAGMGGGIEGGGCWVRQGGC